MRPQAFRHSRRPLLGSDHSQDQQDQLPSTSRQASLPETHKDSRRSAHLGPTAARTRCIAGALDHRSVHLRETGSASRRLRAVRRPTLWRVGSDTPDLARTRRAYRRRAREIVLSCAVTALWRASGRSHTASFRAHEGHCVPSDMTSSTGFRNACQVGMVLEAGSFSFTVLL